MLTQERAKLQQLEKALARTNCYMVDKSVGDKTRFELYRRVNGKSFFIFKSKSVRTFIRKVKLSANITQEHLDNFPLEVGTGHPNVPSHPPVKHWSDTDRDD